MDDVEFAEEEPIPVVDVPMTDNEVELKAEVLKLDISKEYNFFKKDLVLGNLDRNEIKILNIYFELISGALQFTNILIKRQYAIYKKMFERNEEFRDDVLRRVAEYNEAIQALRAEIEKQLEDPNIIEEEKEELKAKLETLNSVTPEEYMFATAKGKAISEFFKKAIEPYILSIYTIINLSRSKSGYQQGMLFEKKIKQTTAVEHRKKRTGESFWDKITKIGGGNKWSL